MGWMIGSMRGPLIY